MSWMFVVYAAVAAMAGIVPWIHVTNDDDEKLYGTAFAVIVGVVNFVLGLVGGYFFTPFFYGPFYGMTSTILLFGAVNAIVASVLREQPTVGSIMFGAVAGIFGIAALSGIPMCQADRYHSLIGTVEDREWEDDESPVDVTHVRTVSREQAEWLGNKVIGEAEGSLGSRYRVGDYHSQRVGDELFWVAPLEFHGIVKWLKYRHSAGFVVVSAEDYAKPARLVTGRKMRYMPSAYLDKYLKRHLYKTYALKGLTEYTFELDDNFEPYWVVTVFRPSITYFGPVVEGVVIVDPETGESQFYRVGDIPDWVDRVYPEAFVERYITYYGAYGQGWWNSWLGQEGVEQPTPHHGATYGDVSLVWSTEDDAPYWFTGVTSVSSSDQSLNGLMMVNSRTGAARRYRVSGSNEIGVFEAINNAVSNFEGWRGTLPIPYNVGGEFTWVAPVIGGNNTFQRIAMVNGGNAMVALGTDVHAALREYRSMLAANGVREAPSSSASTVTAKLMLSRIAVEVVSGRTQFYLYTNDVPDRVFSATSDISPELAISQIGETVIVGYEETSEPIVQITSFDNLALFIRRHDEQVRLDERESSE